MNASKPLRRKKNIERTRVFSLNKEGEIYDHNASNKSKKPKKKCIYAVESFREQQQIYRHKPLGWPCPLAQRKWFLTFVVLSLIVFFFFSRDIRNR
jgi:hypothetical protein